MIRRPLVLFIFLIFFSCQAELRHEKSSKAYSTMALFGGSYTVIPEADFIKDYWKSQYGISIRDYGVRGAGFSILTSEDSIPRQVELACSDMTPAYDIYILWASSNDFIKCNDNVGNLTDYSAYDNYSLSSLGTQCGGINYSITKIKEKAPNALILFLSSIPVFITDKGYSLNCSDSDEMSYFVMMQKKCCLIHGVAFLDQFNGSAFTQQNFNDYYQTDGIHLNENGYKMLLKPQISFFSSVFGI